MRPWALPSTAAQDTGTWWASFGEHRVSEFTTWCFCLVWQPCSAQCLCLLPIDCPLMHILGSTNNMPSSLTCPQFPRPRAEALCATDLPCCRCPASSLCLSPSFPIPALQGFSLEWVSVYPVVYFVCVWGGSSCCSKARVSFSEFSLWNWSLWKNADHWKQSWGIQVCSLEYPTVKTDVSYPSKHSTVVCDKHSAQSRTEPHRWGVVIVSSH